MSQFHEDSGRMARDMAMCAFCPKMCRAVCPVGNAEARETTITWGKMWQAYRVVEHQHAVDAEVAEIFDACTGCGACTEFCEHGVDAAGALFEMRRHAADAGHSPRAVELGELFDASARCCVEDLAEGYAQEIDGPEGPTALYPGRVALTVRPGLAALAWRVLQETGASIGALGTEARAVDVGQPLLWAGLRSRFEDNARRVAAALDGVATLVCLDPEDAYFLSTVYPLRGVPVRPRVTTVVEELSRRIDRLPQRPGPRLVYHDPCYLGRRMGIYSAPRRVVAQVLGEPPLEFAWCREHAECSCGGGLYPQARPDAALVGARHRWESRPEQAEGIVTACPGAEVQLARAGAEVLDVVELVAGVRVGCG